MTIIRNLHVSVTPCHFDDVYSELRITVDVGGKRVTHTETLLDDDMISRFDLYFTQAREALRLAIKEAA